MFVYISGPLSAKDGYTVEQNVAAAAKVYFALLSSGVHAFCPHLGGLFPSAWTAVSYAQWLAYDFAVIKHCTHVLMIDRWETSNGAVLEKAYAESIGKIVLTDATALLGVAI